MALYRSALVLSLSALWLPLSACQLQIDKIFEMQPGSDLSLVYVQPSGPIPQGVLRLQGGTVMRIDVSTSLLDYLDGTVDGDVEFLELLFASNGFAFFGLFQTGVMCIGLNLADPGGGAFTYDVLDETASFDVTVNTIGEPTNLIIQPLLPGGFDFPFQFQSEIPMTLVDGLALFTGGDLTITQDVDETFVVQPEGFANPFNFHIFGTVTLNTVDVFPVTDGVIHCLDYYENGPTLPN